MTSPISAVPNLKKDADYTKMQNTYGDLAVQMAYDGSDNLIYIGLARPGSDASLPVWQIRKLNYTGTNLTSITWPQLNACVTSDFSFIWANRASYTYL
jgi:hypothetical protein